MITRSFPVLLIAAVLLLAAARAASAQPVEPPSQTEGRPTPSLAEAQTILRDILSRQEFRGLGRETWSGRLGRQLQEWWLRFLRWLRSQLRQVAPATEPFASIALVVIIVIALGLTLARWMRRREEALTVTESRPMSRGSWNQWTRDAISAAARGDFREAVRRAYWAALDRGQEIRAWKLDDSRTPREYLRAIPQTHPNRGSLSNVICEFERAWFAHAPVTSQQFAHVLSNLEQIGCVIPPGPAIAAS